MILTMSKFLTKINASFNLRLNLSIYAGCELKLWQVFMKKIKSPKYTTQRHYLNTRLSQINAQSIRIFAVVFNKFLKGTECSSSGNEESTFVQLSYSIMFDSIPITYCKRKHVFQEPNKITTVISISTKNAKNFFSKYKIL